MYVYIYIYITTDIVASELGDLGREQRKAKPTSASSVELFEMRQAFSNNNSSNNNRSSIISSRSSSRSSSSRSST